MERVACTLCGGSRQRTIMRVHDTLQPRGQRFRLVRCRNCGLVFLNPRPSIEEIGRFYPALYGMHVQALRGRAKESLYKRIPALLFGDPDIPERLDSDPYFTGRRGRVLDVGTGGGELLVEFHKRGWQATGLEPFCQPSPLSKNLNLDIKRVSFEEAEFPSAHFNIVIMNYVLEHLHKPLEALKKAQRILVPGGLVYVGVQNFDAFFRRIFNARWFPLEIPRHMSQFTKLTMTKFAQASGLRIVKIRNEAASNALRESLLRHFVSSKYGGGFPGNAINRVLRTPAMKVAAALVAGVIAKLGKSDIVGYYMIKD